MSTSTDTVEQLATQDYKYGFVTDIESDTLPPGLNEDVIRAISRRKDEPEWLLEWRLKAYRALADDARSRPGTTSTTIRSTIRTSSTTRRPRRSRR